LLLATIVGQLALADVGHPIKAIVLAGLFAGIVMLNSRPEGLTKEFRSAAGSETTDFLFSTDAAGSLTDAHPDPLAAWDPPPIPEPTQILNLDATPTRNRAPEPDRVPDPGGVSDPDRAPDPGGISEPGRVPDPGRGLDGDSTGEPESGSDPTLEQHWLPPTGPDPGPTKPVSSPPDPPDQPLVPPGATSAPAQARRTHWAVARMADETVDTVAKPPTPPGPAFGSIALAALAAVLGVALVLNTVADIFVGATTVIGTGMAVVGLLMTIAAFVGRARRLVPLAVILLILLPVSPIIDHAVNDGVGSSTIVVTSPDELQPAYQLGVGSLFLDLSDLAITEDTVIEAKVGTGGLEVVVPRGVPVLAQGETTVGGLWILGEGRGGVGNRLQVRPESSVPDDAPRLILDVSTTIGSVDVYRTWSERDVADEAVPDESVAEPPPIPDDSVDEPPPIPDPFDDEAEQLDG
jgi:predicted membrane protein